MHKLLLAAGAALFASSAYAEDPAILVCDEVIKAQLIAPATYERIRADIDGREVQIEFDAVNKFNAPLRETMACYFLLSPAGEIVLWHRAFDGTAGEVSNDELIAVMREFSPLVEAAQRSDHYPIHPDQTELTFIPEHLSTMLDGLGFSTRPGANRPAY